MAAVPTSSGSLVGIEYPAYLKDKHDLSKVTSSLGGHLELQDCLKKKKVMKLSFRPENVFAHAVPGVPVTTSNSFLLRLRVTVSKNSSTHDSHPLKHLVSSSATLPTPPEQKASKTVSKVEFLRIEGVFSHIFRFQAIADFQFTPGLAEVGDHFNLNQAVEFSPSYTPPYQFSRLLSTINYRFLEKRQDLPKPVTTVNRKKRTKVGSPATQSSANTSHVLSAVDHWYITFDADTPNKPKLEDDQQQLNVLLHLQQQQQQQQQQHQHQQQQQQQQKQQQQKQQKKKKKKKKKHTIQVTQVPSTASTSAPSTPPTPSVSTPSVASAASAASIPITPVVQSAQKHHEGCVQKNEDQDDLELLSFEEIFSMFQKRPIWSPILLDHVWDVHKFQYDWRKFMKYIAYTFTSGPWRFLWVRLSYNPRLHTGSMMYQMVEIRMVQSVQHTRHLPVALQTPKELRAVTQLQNDGVTNLAMMRQKEQTKDPFFLSQPKGGTAYYQLCDIIDEDVQAHVDTFTAQEVCNRTTGWLNSSNVTSLRQMLKKKAKQFSHSS